NLERLARLDRLGGRGLNCFDAVEGVGGALRRVWEIEKKKRETMGEGRQEDVESEVTCNESGKPTMHTGGRLGLSLQYWHDGRHLAKWKRRADQMDIDGPPAEQSVEGKPIWSATIECEPSSADLYPSARVSNDWVIEAAEKQNTTQHDPFTTSNNNDPDALYLWQDPPPKLISPPPSDPDLMNIDTDADTFLAQSKPPDVRFIARLNPPVLVPLQTALNIYESVGAPLPQESIQPTTFDSLLLPNEDRTPSISNTERIAKRHIYTPPPQTGDETEKLNEVEHTYTLFTEPQSYARNVEDIPFSHPRQLISLLPVLRQWALVSSLLRRCCAPPVPSGTDGTAANGHTSPPNDDDISSSTSTDEDENPPAKDSKRRRVIDISLFTSGTIPRINLTFPRQNRLVDVSFCIGLNAGIEGVEVSTAGKEEDDGGETKSEERREKVKRVLQIGEDMGVLVEWMGGGG
ncbi:MAG: hypothetical protein Q9170_007906, partial [Blastenia crenularia]